MSAWPNFVAIFDPAPDRRGFGQPSTEIDAVDFGRKSFGNTYALQNQTNDPKELAKLLMKLCEKTGRRLRHASYSAHGVHVAMVFTDLSWWHTGRKFDLPVYSTQEIYEKAMRLLNRSGYPGQTHDRILFSNGPGFWPS